MVDITTFVLHINKSKLSEVKKIAPQIYNY